MNNFRPGDKVVSESGSFDVVQSVPGMPEYDSQNFRSPESGFLLEQRHWCWQHNWKLVNTKKPKYYDKAVLDMVNKIKHEI